MANDPQRGIEDDPGQRRIEEDQPQRSMPIQRGGAHGTATISREDAARERQAQAPIEHRPPANHLPLKIAGILGLLLLGGLIAGLVVSNTPSTSAPATATATPRTISSFGAHGSAVSPNFVVHSSPVTSTYGYSCPAGVSGRFIANLVRSDGSDSHAIVNTTAPSTSGTSILHPADVGSLYHVAVTAPAGCGYSINTAAP